jgi:diguanylate cyclase (GGDEF)-like protein
LQIISNGLDFSFFRIIRVSVYQRNSPKTWFVPGGVVLLVAAVALQPGLLPISAQAIDFYYYAVFALGILLAWRFHSSRVMFALITLLLAHRAIEFFSNGQILAAGSGRIAFEAAALLMPINFLVFSITAERGFVLPAVASRLSLLFFESVFVAVICRPGETSSPRFVRVTLLNAHWFEWTKVPQLALLAFVVAFGVLVFCFLLYHKPVENGLMWSLAATFLGFQAGAVGQLGSAYFATAGLILIASLVENSYFLAYHDELTALPARRAFNDALLSLEPPYALAAVDIDHFKRVNDTYGHDTGDQVLSMVAARLSRVGSRGQAYRVGGEEFSILFPGKTVKEVMPDLEALRIAVSESSFRVRVSPERRRTPRGTDRRDEKRHKIRPPSGGHPQVAEEFSVTVSIGVAEPSARTREIEEVIQAAGRNRVEMSAPPHLSLARSASSQ